MNSKIHSLTEKLRDMGIAIEEQTNDIEKLKQDLENAKKKSEELTKEFKTKEKIIQLLPNADENIEKLKLIVQKSKEKLG